MDGVSNGMGRLVGSDRRRSLFVCAFAAMLVACSADGGGGSAGPGGGFAGVGGTVASAGGAGGLIGVGGASGGNVGGTAGAAGGAGTGGGSPSAAPTTMTEACIAYVTAQLSRRDECDNGPQRPGYYLTASSACPDLIFSDGSVRTIDSTNACTEEWRRYACDLVNAYIPPSCAVAGKRAPGEGCLYSTQCDSSTCDSRGGTCGTCQRAAAAGESCTGGGVVCQPDATCTGGVCVKIVPEPLPPPVAPQPVGAPCVSFSDCATDLYCLHDAQNVATCQPYPATGQPCTPAGGNCRVSDYCDQPSSICKALPTAGQPCGLLAGNPFYCATNLYCDTKASSGPTCVSLLLPGAACPAPLSICHPGTTCQGGVCKPIDSQGLFAAACPAP